MHPLYRPIKSTDNKMHSPPLCSLFSGSLISRRSCTFSSESIKLPHGNYLEISQRHPSIDFILYHVMGKTNSHLLDEQPDACCTEFRETVRL